MLKSTIPFSRRERAANATRRLLSMARDPELDGATADMCRGLANVAMDIGTREIPAEEREKLKTAMQQIQQAIQQMEVKA